MASDENSAAKWIDSHWKGNRTCEICSENKWTLSKDIVTPVVFEKKEIKIGAATYPQIMLICSVCGNTKYFNAVIMGLVKDESR